MNQITIKLSQEQYQELQQIANQQDISPEKILESKIAEWLQESQIDFNQAVNYVLTKNSELYQRLAWLVILPSRSTTVGTLHARFLQGFGYGDVVHQFEKRCNI